MLGRQFFTTSGVSAMPDKQAVASWLERLAERMTEFPGCRNDQPLLVAYAAAAKKAGFDADLVKRISEVAAQDEATGTELAKELKAIVAEARSRHATLDQ